MRSFLAAVLLGALALPARADVLDSGSLVIGQQGVIGGTLTVQGNAFSVGGSTFSVSYGSVNVGGLFKPSSAGIQWADGTVSTTASSGGGGDALLAATQTFSGANSYSSRLAIGSPTLGMSTHSVIGIWVKSVSGQTDATGCVMVISAVNSSGYMVVTSTNSGINISAGGLCVLQSDCAPGSLCFCATHGLVYLKGNSATTVGNVVSPSTTRCNSSNESPASASTYNGYIIQCDGSNPKQCYAMLGIH